MRLANRFPSDLNKNLTSSPNQGGIISLRDLAEDSTNIQNTKEILGIREDVSLRLKSCKTKLFIKYMFTIVLILEVEKIFEKQGAAEKGDTDF